MRIGTLKRFGSGYRRCPWGVRPVTILARNCFFRCFTLACLRIQIHCSSIVSRVFRGPRLVVHIIWFRCNCTFLRNFLFSLTSFLFTRSDESRIRFISCWGLQKYPLDLWSDANFPRSSHSPLVRCRQPRFGYPDWTHCDITKLQSMQTISRFMGSILLLRQCQRVRFLVGEWR